MTGPQPPPEGRITGAGECKWCPYQTACLGAPIEELGEAECERIAALKAEAEEHERRARAARESIRDILRATQVTRRWKGAGLARPGIASRKQ
jgi:hypothetical protein